MIAAHATCTDGIADSCGGSDFPNAGYTACPNSAGVSATCSEGTRRAAQPG